MARFSRTDRPHPSDEERLALRQQAAAKARAALAQKRTQREESDVDNGEVIVPTAKALTPEQAVSTQRLVDALRADPTLAETLLQGFVLKGTVGEPVPAGAMARPPQDPVEDAEDEDEEQEEEEEDTEALAPSLVEDLLAEAEAQDLLTPVPPLPGFDETEFDGMRGFDIPLVDEQLPAAFAGLPPQAVEFTPSVGLLTRFFPKYQPKSVFYVASMRLRDRIMGGTPADPNLMEGWLRRLGLGVEKSDELRAIIVRTMRELGADLTEEPTWEDLEAASKKLAEFKQTNMFRRHPKHGCALESRVVKAMLREAVNIAFADQRMGPTRKGARSYFSERVFVDPDFIPLVNERPDRFKPDGTHLFIGHVSGPQGRQSTLTYYEYLVAPVIRFTIRVYENCIPDEMWGGVWECAQENGQGSLRSQGFGRFDLCEWQGPFKVAQD